MGQVSETVAAGPAGYGSILALTPVPTLAAWRVELVWGALLFFLTEYLRIFLKKELMRGSLSLVLKT